MTNEELNKALLEKLNREKERYVEWLLSQPLDEILNGAYQYYIMNDVILYLEDHNLDDEQAQALLDMESPLYNAFERFEDIPTGHMDHIKVSIELLANQQIHQKREQMRELRETPLYHYPSDYARENGELEAYRASKKANIACREAIDGVLTERFRGAGLDNPAAAVKEMADQFGFERVLFVLANTVRWHSSDRRFSADNRQWADTIPVFDHENGKDRGRSDYVLRSHPAKANEFITAVRREYLLRQPLTRDEIRTEAWRIFGKLKNAREPNSPNGTHFMAKISPDFLARAKQKDRTALLNLLPFQTIAFSPLKGQKGTFALISATENRDAAVTLKRSRAERKKKNQER